MSEPNPLPEASRPPTTTTQQDITLAGQRRINLIWEYTQAVIAVSVVLCNLAVAVHIGFTAEPQKVEFPPMLSNSLFLVIGFYFSRTNHAAIGGIGAKATDNQAFLGRSLVPFFAYALYQFMRH
jgi:hypothetical protein